MTQFLLDNWQLIAALIAAIWAIFTYFFTQGRELAWKRTEFIVDQSFFLDNDREMRECTLILYEKHPDFRVLDFIDAVNKGSEVDDRHIQLIIKFEKYLNFIWRICYAHIALKTLTKKDLLAFGAYLLAIEDNSQLRQYCIDEGYDEIITAADKIKDSI
jgi:hypothetical protein